MRRLGPAEKTDEAREIFWENRLPRKIPAGRSGAFNTRHPESKGEDSRGL
jgi:hypothetical protein